MNGEYQANRLRLQQTSRKSRFSPEEPRNVAETFDFNSPQAAHTFTLNYIVRRDQKRLTGENDNECGRVSKTYP